MKLNYVITLGALALLLMAGISFAIIQPSEADILTLFLTEEQITALASHQQTISPQEALALRIAGKTIQLPAPRPVIEGKVVEEVEQEQQPSEGEKMQSEVPSSDDGVRYENPEDKEILPITSE